MSPPKGVCVYVCVCVWGGGGGEVGGQFLQLIIQVQVCAALKGVVLGRFGLEKGTVFTTNLWIITFCFEISVIDCHFVNLAVTDKQNMANYTDTVVFLLACL